MAAKKKKKQVKHLGINALLFPTKQQDIHFKIYIKVHVWAKSTKGLLYFEWLDQVNDDQLVIIIDGKKDAFVFESKVLGHTVTPDGANICIWTIAGKFYTNVKWK